MNSREHGLDAAAFRRAAYIHIPFCRRRCPYCDFAVVEMRDAAGNIDRYVAALLAEVEMEPDWGPLSALNFGGGTPSALGAGQLAELIDAVRSRFGLVGDAEISMEANPEDWTDEYAASIRAVGIDRVSLGVQSFDRAVLEFLGRDHRPSAGEDAVVAARRAGIGSVNIDLILGTPGETLESWRSTVARTLDLEPDHVSAYALTVELGTALSRAVQAGGPAPDDDDQADKYEYFSSQAAQAGLDHYEVSNWARSGHACRYNLTTWAHGEYAAFGTGAHGYRDGIRSRNVRRLDRYLEMVESGTRPRAGTEQLSGWRRERERLYVGLRRTAGVLAGDLGRRFLESRSGEHLAAAGVIEMSNDRLVVTKPLLTDAVARELLAFTPEAE